MIDLSVWRDSARRLGQFLRRYPLENAIEFVTFIASTTAMTVTSYLFATAGDRLMDPGLALGLIAAIVIMLPLILADRLVEIWTYVRIGNKERFRNWRELTAAGTHRFTLTTAFEELADSWAALTSVIGIGVTVPTSIVLGFFVYALNPGVAPFVFILGGVAFLAPQFLAGTMAGIGAKRAKLENKRTRLVHNLDYASRFNRSAFLREKVRDNVQAIRGAQHKNLGARARFGAVQSGFAQLINVLMVFGIILLQGGGIDVSSLGYVALTNLFFQNAQLTSELIADVRDELRTLREFDEEKPLEPSATSDIAIMAETPSELLEKLSGAAADNFQAKIAQSLVLQTPDNWARELSTFSYGERVRILSAWLTSQGKADLGPELWKALDQKTMKAWREAYDEEA